MEKYNLNIIWQLPNYKTQHLIDLLGRHLTPASSACVQLPVFPSPECGQSIREVSLPLQARSLSRMEPLPLPKWASVKGVAAVCQFVGRVICVVYKYGSLK